MFYFLNIVIVLYNLLLYGMFRSGIHDYLRLSKMSKTNIKKKTKGFGNYWLYVAVNRENPFGVLYYLNIVFLFVSILFSISALTIGFIAALQPVVTVIGIILCVVQIPSMFLASMYSDKAEYGRYFVLWAKRREQKTYHSSIVMMFPWIVTAVFIWASLTL